MYFYNSRKTDDAFTLDCAVHPEDNCRHTCWFCKDMCTDHLQQKVFSCPENPDKKIAKTGAAIGGIVIIIVIVVVVLIICVVGISCCVYYGRQRRGPMGKSYI